MSFVRKLIPYLYCHTTVVERTVIRLILGFNNLFIFFNLNIQYQHSYPVSFKVFILYLSYSLCLCVSCKIVGDIEKQLENGTSKNNNDYGPITSITEAQLSDPDSDNGLASGDY